MRLMDRRESGSCMLRARRPLRGVMLLMALFTATSGDWYGVAWALTLSTPVEGAVLQSGEMVPVSVEVGKEDNLRNVKYYWYRADEEPLASPQAKPAPFIRGGVGGPFSGTVRIPADALGTMRLLAVGEVTRGRLAGYEDFDEVLVTVEPAATLTGIEFAVGKPWRLDTIGQRVVVPVVGQFSDGVLRPLTSWKAGPMYRSSDESVVEVDASGNAYVTGNGKATIIVEHHGKAELLEVHVDADASDNQAPIARTALELNVKTGSLVVLDGLRSSDPDGDPLRYSWKQIRGHRVPLTNVNEAKATFIAPPLSEPKSFQFALTVTDMEGPDRVKGAESPPAIITVLVSP